MIYGDWYMANVQIRMPCEEEIDKAAHVFGVCVKFGPRKLAVLSWHASGDDAKHLHLDVSPSPPQLRTPT
jgi:hypothetical protein